MQPTKYAAILYHHHPSAMLRRARLYATTRALHVKNDVKSEISEFTRLHAEHRDLKYAVRLESEAALKVEPDVHKQHYVVVLRKLLRLLATAGVGKPLF